MPYSLTAPAGTPDETLTPAPAITAELAGAPDPFSGDLTNSRDGDPSGSPAPVALEKKHPPIVAILPPDAVKPGPMERENSRRALAEYDAVRATTLASSREALEVGHTPAAPWAGDEPVKGSPKPGLTEGQQDLWVWNDLQEAKELLANPPKGGLAAEVAEARIKRAKEVLEQHIAYRRARGESAFPYLAVEQKREKERLWREQLPSMAKLFSGPDMMAEALPAEQRAAFQARIGESPDPRQESMKVANLKLVETVTGQPLSAFGGAMWNMTRDHFARERLGLSGEVSEEDFYQAAGKALAREQADSELAEKIATRAAVMASRGQPLSASLAEAKQMAGENWWRFHAAVRAGHDSITGTFPDQVIVMADSFWAEFNRARFLEPQSRSPEAMPLAQAFVAYGRMKQEEREKVLGLLAIRARDEGVDVEGLFPRMGEGFKSGVYQIAGGMTAFGTGLHEKKIRELLSRGEVSASIKPGDAVKQQATLLLGGITPDNEEFRVVETRPLTREERDHFQLQLDGESGFRAFLTDLPGAGIAARRYLDSTRDGLLDTLGDTLVMAAESLPMMATAAIPYGGGILLNAAAYSEHDLAELRAENPDADPAQLESVSLGSGMLKSGLDRFQVQMLGARMPMTVAALGRLKLAVGAPVAGALRFGASVTGDIVGEVAQDVSLSAMKELAAALRMDIEGPDWDAVWQREWEALGDISRVSLLFGTISGAGHLIAGKVDPQVLRQALQDREGLALAGYGEDSIRRVAAAAESDPETAAEILRQEAAKTPVAVRRENSAKARAALEGEEGEKAAIPGTTTDPVESPGVDATGIAEPAGAIPPGEAPSFSTPLSPSTPPVNPGANPGAEAAAAGLPAIVPQADGSLRIDLPDGESLSVSDPDEAREILHDWDARDERETTRAVRKILDYFKNYHAANPSLEFSGRETGLSPNLETWAGKSRERIARAQARVDIFLRQAGRDLGITRPLLSDIPVLGTSRNTREGDVTRIAAEIHQRGDALTVIEEHAEGVGKWLMHEGGIGEQRMIGWLRELESKSGQRLLSDQLMELPADLRMQEIVEAFSHAALNNAVGKIQDSALPAPVKAFFRAFRERIASVLRLASDITLLRSEGQLDADFGYWLDVAGGLDAGYRKGGVDPSRSHQGGNPDQTQADTGVDAGADTAADTLSTPDHPSVSRTGPAEIQSLVRPIDPTPEHVQNADHEHQSRNPAGILEALTGRQGQENDHGGVSRPGGGQRRKHGRELASGDRLAGWAEDNGRILTPDPILEALRLSEVGGGEHRVLFDEASGRVLKLTKPGLFGAQAEDAGAYLERWALYNRAFGDDVAFEGMVTLPGEHAPRAVISQRAARGRDATAAEMRAYLEEKGFHEVEDQRWIHPIRGIVAWDTITPGNMITTADGVRVVDLQLAPAPAAELARLREETGIGRLTSFSIGMEEGDDRSVWDSPEKLEAYKRSLPTKPTPRRTKQDLFEIEHTGELNFLIEGGGVKFWADNVEGTEIHEAKCVVKPKISPFIADTNAPEFIRKIVRRKVEKEFKKMALIVSDPSNPLRRVKVKVNDPGANAYFYEMLKKYGLDGEVVNPK